MYLENDREERSEELLTLAERLGYNAWWHLPFVFNPENFFGDPVDFLGGMVSANVLCVPKESTMPVNGLHRVESPQQKLHRAK